VELNLILPLYSFEALLGSILYYNAQYLVLWRRYFNVFRYFEIKNKIAFIRVWEDY